MPQPLLTALAGALLAQAPHAPDGFVVELVVQHPEVKWPSAVHCLADGSLLVAEDPMDMPGPTDQPLDRIWRLRFAADGTCTKTLFAEGLFAVMGLQEIDDTVYVMNMPHLTVLRDRDGDGVAEERTELLTDLGPPAPGWPGGFNDHIVSGLRLGMDGFLYVSVGDKGIPLAHGTDGSTVTLRGGGVVRVRPDGKQLELVASGTRNHLDVMLDERDQIFTCDNTDDGLGWWTRLSHVMPTGYYGYPWDYRDHPERALPPMRDDGGGSPVGGLVYRDDAWPEEYRGDLFSCEWADRVLRRFKLAPDGASFRCVLAEDFVTPGDSGEFRPLDVCESPDGRCLYVADWNFPGWTDPTEAGRVWRIRRADDRPGTPPFGELRDATMASLAKASVADLLKNLDHPGFGIRIAAQRELARRGDFNALGHFVLDRKTSNRARRHALWAIDAGCERDRGFLASMLDHDEAEVRAEAARAIGQRRGAPPGSRQERRRTTFEQLGVMVAKDPDLIVRREAAIALGRIGDGKSLWPLVCALDSTDDLFVRFAVRQAIRALPCDWPLLLQKFLPLSSPRVQEDLWLALRELYDPALVTELARDVSYAFYSPTQRARALTLLADVCRKPEPWDGRWWQTQPAKSPPPAKSVEWEGTAFAVFAIDQAFRSDEPELRSAALAAVRTTREPRLFGCVRAQLDGAADPAERVALLAIARELGDREAAPQCRRALVHSDAGVRAAGIVALEGLLGAEALPDIEPRLADEDESVRAAALEACARHPDAVRLQDYVRGLTLGESTRSACRNAIASLRTEVRPALEASAERGELAPAALAILRELYDEPQPVPRWQLFGPFARDVHVLLLEEGPGSNVLGQIVSDDEVDASAPHGFVDFEKSFDESTECCAYAVATLDAPVARDARCLVGSDDGVTVWVNGALVHEHPGDRGWSPDEDRFPVALAAGPNRIVLRVEQGGGEWSFNVKVTVPGVGPLFADAPAPVAFDREAWRDYALANGGDPARGKALFQSAERAACSRCHAIAGSGPKIGPDLRDVGKKYGRAELIASILEPSQKIQEGYRATNVFLKNGDVVSGLLTHEEQDVLTLADPTGALRELRAEEVASRRESKLSAMPDGLADRFSCQEFADLVAWLETLRD